MQEGLLNMLIRETNYSFWTLCPHIPPTSRTPLQCPLLSDEAKRLLPEARIGIADIADIKPSCQLDVQILAIQPVFPCKFRDRAVSLDWIFAARR